MTYKPYVYKRAEELGIPVIEGKRRLFVTVTSNDIVLAKKKDSKHCALARAALRLPDVAAAYVFRSKAFIEYSDKMVRFDLPQSARTEIVSFDRAGIFAEGVYQLTPPAPSDTRKAKTANNRSRRSGSASSKSRKSMTKSEQADLSKAMAAQSTNVGGRQDSKVSATSSAAGQKHVGDRTVSGIKSARAPEPLPGKAPTRYVHRTQYVRDLREPA